MSFVRTNHPISLCHSTPGYNLAVKGVHAPNGIRPQVYTTTMGNYVSLATGLYQESHGHRNVVFELFKKVFF
jgi:predicted AlkP superfamily pyrophosphatase or phosphodiesterase